MDTTKETQATLEHRPGGKGNGAGGTSLVGTQFLLATIATFAYFTAVGVAIPVLPRYVRDELNLGNDVVGWMVALYAFAAIFSRPIIRWITVRYGLRILTIFGGVIGVLGFALQPLAPSVFGVGLLRIVAGLAEAAFFIGGATIVNNLAPAERRAEAASLYSVGLFVGLGIGPIIGDRLSENAQYSAAFLVAAGFVGLGTVLAVMLDRDRPDQIVAPSKVPLFHPSGLRVGIAFACSVAGYVGWTSFLALRADEVGGVSAGRIFLAYSVIVLAFRLFGARVPETVGLVRCAVASFTLYVVGLLAAALLDGASGLWISALILSAAVALMYPAMLGIAMQGAFSDSERSATLSTFTMFFEVGAALGGIVLGQIAERFGYRAAFGGGAGVAFLGLPLLWLLVLRHRRQVGLTHHLD